MKAKYLVPTLLILVLIFYTGSAISKGRWMEVVNEKEKLLGSILLGDEHGESWKEGELPEGWKEISIDYWKKLKDDPNYIKLGQILPTKRDGKIYFGVIRSKLRQNLNALQRLENLPEIELR